MVPKGEPVLFEVELVDLEEQAGSGTLIMAEAVSNGEGDAEVLCGDNITINYKLLEEDKEGTVTFRVGQGSVPTGVERGVLGMKTGEIKKLTLPYKLLQTSAKSILPEDIKFSKDRNTIFEIELVGIR